jgi:hypothetical protein
MRKILVFGLVLVCGVCFGQEQPKIDMQDWFKRGMNTILANNNTTDKKYNCYFKNNEFYLACEYQINLPYSTCIEHKNEIYDMSKEAAYRSVEMLKYAISEDFEKIYNTKYINVSFSLLTNDFKNIDYKYFIKASDLYKIVSYYNKKDFFEILN